MQQAEDESAGDQTQQAVQAEDREFDVGHPKGQGACRGWIWSTGEGSIAGKWERSETQS